MSLLKPYVNDLKEIFFVLVAVLPLFASELRLTAWATHATLGVLLLLLALIRWVMIEPGGSFPISFFAFSAFGVLAIFFAMVQLRAAKPTARNFFQSVRT